MNDEDRIRCGSSKQKGLVPKLTFCSIILNFLISDRQVTPPLSLFRASIETVLQKLH